MIEIKITTENVKEAQQEMLQLLQGTYFGKPVKQGSEPEAPEVSAGPAEGTPLAEEKPTKTKTARKTTKQKEAPKVEEPEEPVKEEEKDEPKEESQTEQKSEEGRYPGDFAGCKDDKEVLNQIRLYIDTFNKISPEHSKKAREIFEKYGVRTLPKLSLDQAIDFYEKLKAEA